MIFRFITLFLLFAQNNLSLCGHPIIEELSTSIWELVPSILGKEENQNAVVISDIDGTLISENVDIYGSYISKEIFITIGRLSIGFFGCTNRDESQAFPTKVELTEKHKLPPFGFFKSEYSAPEIGESIKKLLLEQNIFFIDNCLYLNSHFYVNSLQNNKGNRICSFIETLQKVCNLKIKTVIFIDNDPRNLANTKFQCQTSSVEKVILITFLPEYAHVVQLLE